MSSLYLLDEDLHWMVETTGGGGAFTTVVKDKLRNGVVVERIHANTENRARTYQLHLSRKYHISTAPAPVA